MEQFTKMTRSTTCLGEGRTLFTRATHFGFVLNELLRTRIGNENKKKRTNPMKLGISPELALPVNAHKIQFYRFGEEKQS